MSTAAHEKAAEKPLQGVVVVFTGVARKNVEKYFREIQRFGGTVSDKVGDSTSYLVVRRVGSDKYVIRWLNDCLHQKTLLAPDAYLARPLEGCVITATQLGLDEREALAKLVAEQGGTYSGDLRIDNVSGNGPATTHLVALSRSGDKYLRASIDKEIRIVSPAWIDACVAEEGWVNERYYPVLSKPEPTPKAIVAAANTQSTCNGAVVTSATTKTADVACVAKAEIQFQDLPRIDDHEPSLALQGQTFYIHGYEPEIRDFIIQLVIKNGGMRYPLLLPGVTAVVFEDTPSNDNFVRTIKRMPFDVATLSIQQLLRECSINRTVSHTSLHQTEQAGTDESGSAIAHHSEFENDETASLGTGAEWSSFTELLAMKAAAATQVAPKKPRLRLWGASSQGIRLSGSSSTQRRSGLSRKQIEGAVSGQTPKKKTRLQQQLEPEPESQQITFMVDS